MYKIEILRPAWDDLEQIGDLYYLLSGPISAQKVTAGILDSIAKLSAFPHGYPTVPDKELAEAGYRMVIYKKYLSIYRVIENTVYIYHIADGRTDYPQIMK